MNFIASDYDLVSVASGRRRHDEGWTLSFEDESPTLIRADYAAKQLELRDELGGLYRFADWLPIRRILKGSASPITYKSHKLAAHLNLKNLWITFSGWWPEKNALMRTGTFKECEAYSVCARMDSAMEKILVVSSAGNTARAFARVCSDNDIRLLLFVPEDNLSALWFDQEIKPCVQLVCPASGGDYYDAIRMSSALIAGSKSFIQEGGAKNIARRDGMGTTVLSAASAIGRIPDVYFQAVGSGTGAIAAREAAMRLESDGRFGRNSMRLIVSQNEPFTPISDSWQADSREFIISKDEIARRLVDRVNAKVLTNRRPPWAIPGGLYDALKASGGSVLTASNSEAAESAELFREMEGIDVSPAAAVAVASLIKAAATDLIRNDEIIMLNITGGGIERIQSDRSMSHLEVSRIFDLDASESEIVSACEWIFV